MQDPELFGFLTLNVMGLMELAAIVINVWNAKKLVPFILMNVSEQQRSSSQKQQEQLSKEQEPILAITCTSRRTYRRKDGWTDGHTHL